MCGDSVTGGWCVTSEAIPDYWGAPAALLFGLMFTLICESLSRTFRGYSRQSSGINPC